MTTTIPTPPISFRPLPLTPADGPARSPAPARRPLVPPAKAPSNDDAERIAPLDDAAYGRLLAHPRVRAYLWARLGPMRLSRQDKEDFVGEVTATLWQRRTDPDPPHNVRRMLALAKRILKGKLVDHWRHLAVVEGDVAETRRRRGERVEDEPTHGAPEQGPDEAADEKREDEPDEEPDVDPDEEPVPGEPIEPRCFAAPPPARVSMTPEDSLDVKQQLQHANDVAARIGLTDDDVEDMYAMTWDDTASYEELAAERGMTPGALKTRLHRLREAVNASWERKVKRTLILTLLLLAMLLLYVLATLGPARNPPPPPAPLPEPRLHEAPASHPAPVAPPESFEDHGKPTR